METCKSGSEGVSVKPDVAIHEGARLLPYKGHGGGKGVSLRLPRGYATPPACESEPNPLGYVHGTRSALSSPASG